MTQMEGKINMYFVVAVFIIAYSGVCFCRCLDAKINREYLEVIFSPCEKLLQKCNFYKLWLEVWFQDEEEQIVGTTEVYINHKSENKSEIFPLYELTDSLHQKLKLNKRYTVSIQPRCTSCDDFCEFMPDMEIPPAVVTSPASIEHEDSRKWLYLAVVMSVFVAIMAAVVTLILVCRYKKTDQDSPLNNIHTQYSSVGKDVENKPTMHSMDRIDIPFSRQIQIISGQGEQETKLNKSKKTINIISLNSDKILIHELLSFIPTTVFKIEVLDPAAFVVENQTGYSFHDKILENRTNIVILNNIVVKDMFWSCNNNGPISKCLILIKKVMTDEDLYPSTYFMSFEPDLELLILNFDTFNVFKSILQKFDDLSGTCKERVNKFNNFLNRIESNELVGI
ncbi:uncharacterized protein LOC134707261 isoform X2 [Mytilus trossulus]|uniref:uncharacterized protein LOC134707261 isoform X2 n=1 Tax=Mytilus trossulus TaxID=6551 RepID=UPI00300683D3